MLDPQLLRENPEAVRAACRLKRIGSPELVDAWLATDEKRRQAQTQSHPLRGTATTRRSNSTSA
jgi:seryl-tRNA synthetase